MIRSARRSALILISLSALTALAAVTARAQQPAAQSSVAAKLAELVAIPGVSGYEQQLGEKIRKDLAAFHPVTDNIGDVVVTIDPPDARDFDDAVSVALDPETLHWQLIVHIADVREDPEYALQAVSQAAEFRSILAVPMIHDGKPIGAFGEGEFWFHISAGVISPQIESAGRLRRTPSPLTKQTVRLPLNLVNDLPPLSFRRRPLRKPRRL